MKACLEDREILPPSVGPFSEVVSKHSFGGIGTTVLNPEVASNSAQGEGESGSGTDDGESGGSDSEGGSNS